MSEHLGHRIQELHKRKGIKSAQAAAKLLGVKRQAVSEVYKRPDVGGDVLLRYTKIAGAKPEDVLEERIEPTSGAWETLIAASSTVGEDVAAMLRLLSDASPDERKMAANVVAAVLRALPR